MYNLQAIINSAACPASLLNKGSHTISLYSTKGLSLGAIAPPILNTINFFLKTTVKSYNYSVWSIGACQLIV